MSLLIHVFIPGRPCQSNGPWNNPAIPAITMPVVCQDKLRLRFKSTLSASRFSIGLLPNTQKYGLRMRRECRERFPCHCGLAIPTCTIFRITVIAPGAMNHWHSRCLATPIINFAYFWFVPMLATPFVQWPEYHVKWYVASHRPNVYHCILFDNLSKLIYIKWTYVTYTQ